MIISFGRHEFAALGQELGFHTDVSDSTFPSIWHPVATIRGVMDGIAIAVQRFPHKHGVIDRARAAIWPPLDLGLRVASEGSVGKAVRAFFGSQDIETGDATFDAPMRVQVDEPDRARALFRTNVRRALLGGALDTVSFEVSDEGVRVEVWHNKKPWREGIPAVANATSLLSAAARKLPVAAALRPWADALEPIAQSYGLALSTCPLSAAGALAGLHVTILFRRIAATKWALELATTLRAQIRWGSSSARDAVRWTSSRSRCASRGRVLARS